MNITELGKCIVEIGANYGGDTQRLYDRYNLPILAVEPTHHLVNELWKKFKDNPNVHIMPVAVDLEPGFKTFKIAGQGDWGCSSLHDFSPEIANLWPGRQDFKFTDSISVPVMTAKQLVDIFGIKEIEYLWVDTQGNDFRVLQSFGESLSIINAGKCEAAYTVSLYSGVDNYYTHVQTYLESYGFTTTVVPDSANKECDIHFVRK